MWEMDGNDTQATTGIGLMVPRAFVLGHAKGMTRVARWGLMASLLVGIQEEKSQE